MEKTKIITSALILLFILIAILIHKKDSNSLDFKTKIRLFPFWVKFMGIAIVLASIIIRWINDFDISNMLETHWQFGSITGLLLICLSKDKIEDEMLIQTRLNAVFISFFGGIIAHIIFVLIDLLYGSTIDSFNSLYLITYILLLYIIIFQVSKRKLAK